MVSFGALLVFLEALVGSPGLLWLASAAARRNSGRACLLWCAHHLAFTTHESHVLVMSFVGDGGVAAPRLKDATLSNSKYRELFSELLVDVRRMYQDCRLVHADFSEYNILYHGGHAHIIDVSQSVDLDHPRCLDFLREDLLHLGQFFAKNGVAVPTVREMFDFVTDPAVTDDNVDACLEALNESAVARGVRKTAR